jgi:hypothetical protein
MRELPDGSVVLPEVWGLSTALPFASRMATSLKMTELFFARDD